jgi:hypothetical protein
MQKYLPFALSVLLIWASSCDHEESKLQQVSAEKKITITDLEHEPAVKDLLSKVQGSSANGRISSLEITDAFFKYSEPDSSILNYTFRLPDDSPDYFENLVLSQYEDGFYGFIYRYIPDGPYIAGDSFKGTFQQYNLAGELIREFTLPAVQDSVGAGGRTQLMNQCVKSIEQTCTTIYEVETRTDYPCHCQYDHKTEVSTICTFSFNRGWCDDMIATPPAGGGGTYIGASDATPRSGGPGGSTGTSTPKPVKKNPVVVVPEPGFDDITFNNVKSPCLVSVIKNLMHEDFKNKINAFAKRKFIDAEQFQNLDFREVSNIVNDNSEPVHARTMPRYLDENRNTHIEIRLNASTLPGTSELFQTVAIYHETMHAVLRLSEGFDSLSMAEQHKEMAASYMVQFMIDGIAEIYGRKLSDSEIKTAAALWLYTTSRDAVEAQQFKDSLTKWNLTVDNIIAISEKEENVVRDKGTGKIKSIGGRNCI